MLDLCEDILFGEGPATGRMPAAQKSPQPATKATEPSLEEQALSIAELAQSVYSLHGNPQPLEMIKLLSSFDGQFLSDGQPKDMEQRIVEELFSMFL